MRRNATARWSPPPWQPAPAVPWTVCVCVVGREAGRVAETTDPYVSGPGPARHLEPATPRRAPPEVSPHLAAAGVRERGAQSVLLDVLPSKTPRKGDTEKGDTEDTSHGG